MTNYSLWIVLPKEVKEVLNKVINKLSEKHNGVLFEPHITLLGDFSCDEKRVVEKTQKLAKKIKALNLEFGEISFSTTYFQNVFVRIKSTVDLMEANLEAKKEFDAENRFFMPHVSLLYGNYTMNVRAKIAQEVVIPALKFQAQKIAVIPNTKEPNSWNYLGEFKSGGK